MAHQYHWEEKGLLRTYIDKISGGEIFDLNLKLHGDMRFDDLEYVINDFTAVTDFYVTEEDIMKIAIVDNVASMSKPVLKIAIVATLEPLLDWINKYLSVMQDSPYQCQVFASLEEARQWGKPTE